MKKRYLRIVAVLLAVLALTAAIYAFSRGGDKQRKYRTEKVDTGDIRATVTATGKIDAVTTVIVGAQTSGMIKAIYVDYNSAVRKGQVLAQIDPSTFAAKVEQARANLLLAQANLEKAAATLQDAKRTRDRNETLFARNLIARSDLDAARTNVETGQAQVNAARAQVEQARAALKQAEIDLDYTTIRSPVDGMVISRNVDIGQTVAASFQTPTLFSIAQDLTKMQVKTSVDEADIGRVRLGQPVEFTVDAYPELVFRGAVSEVRNSPTTVSNVVTYEVIVQVANPELKLKPGMTANVSIIIDGKKGVLRVPSAALRFRMIEAGGKKEPAGARAPQLWLLVGDKPRKVSVATGISDGTYTEITGGGLLAGQEVIVESLENSKKRDNAGAPTPRFIR
ncbi:MAG TPA: efflux RND transporter periplasmic adaptor subunit [Syntrophales bacterium]|nr:efflux RND transporter periplasmic adaptor subunit [Syntrophales bacterium]